MGPALNNPSSISVTQGGALLVRFPGRNADFGAVGGVEVHPGEMFHGLTSGTVEAELSFSFSVQLKITLS